MSESKLIKDFKTKDVSRMRNIITKDYNAKTGVQIGYVKKYIEHNEGDVWEENNKNWTIKSGIKQTISKLDEIKKILQLPLICPNCKKSIKDFDLNRKMYFMHKMCFNCVIEFESNLKIQGKYKEYEQNIIQKGVIIYIKELEDLMLELALNNNSESFITEAGDIEKWSGGNIDKNSNIEEISGYIKYLKEIHNL